jgi:lysophospholipase L1-like esterase
MAELRLCFLGDSFVNGTGDPACLGWAGRLCQAANRRGHVVTYYNLGIRRETSAELRQRWREEVRRRLSSEHDGRLVFSFGVNDTTAEGAATRVALAASLANTQAILEQARRAYPLLLVGPPPVVDEAQNSRIAGLSECFAQLAGVLDVPYLAVYAALRGSRTWVAEVAAGDGAHPGAGGYAALARLVDRWPAWRAWLGEAAESLDAGGRRH